MNTNIFEQFTQISDENLAKIEGGVDIVGIAVMVFQVHGMHLEKQRKTMLVVMKKFIEELLAQ